MLFSIVVALFSLSCAVDYIPVKELNLTQYDGMWYEVYGDRVDRSFQGTGSCITAQYKLLDSGNVSVYNREITKNGTIESIDGYAFYEDNNSGGELTVFLSGQPMPAPYWVIELGPIVDDKYDYAIVTDDKGLTLFVLARDVITFFELYDDDVMDSLVDFGFTKKFNEPILIDQYTLCNGVFY